MGAEHGWNRAAGQASAIFALGLSARWIYVRQAGDQPLWDIPVGTAITFVERAGSGVSEFVSPYDALLTVAAGLAGSTGMAGTDFALVRGIQVVLGACNCVLVWSLAQRAFSSRVAVAAGLAAALYGPSIYFSGELRPTVLSTSLVLLSLIALSRALVSESRSFFLSGLLLGLTLLAQWSLSLFALATVVWMLIRKDHGAAGRLAVGIGAVLLSALLWSSWKPDAIEPGLAEGFHRLYYLWHGSEFLTELDPYFARQHSSLLAALLWDAGLAFPSGVIAPLALVAIGLRLGTERNPMESGLLLFCLCFAAQALLFPTVDMAARATAVPVLLIFAAGGVATLFSMSQRRAQAAVAAGFVLAAGLNMGGTGDTGHARQHHWLGYAFGQVGARANAVREYEAAIALNPESMDTYHALAEQYLAQGDNLRAGGLYESLLQRWPDQVEARLALAEQYMVAGRAPAAVQQYRRLLPAATDSTPAHLLFLLGKALEGSGDFDEGIRAYRRALELEPANSEVRSKLAVLYTVTNQLPLAADAYRALVEEGRLAEFGPPLAAVLIGSQRNREAEEILEQVLQVAPESTTALALRGKQLFAQEHHSEAAALFERLRSLSPEDHRVYYFLTEIYEQLGERARAEDAYALYVRYWRQTELEGVQEHMQSVTSAITEKFKAAMETR